MVQKFVRTVLASPNSNFIRVILCLSEQKKKATVSEYVRGCNNWLELWSSKAWTKRWQNRMARLWSLYFLTWMGGASTSAPLLRTKQTTGEMGRTVRRVDEGY